LTAFYPSPGQLLRVALPALLVAQFLVWPLISLHSPHAGLIAAELIVVWFMALFIRRRRLASADLLLLNAVPLATLVIALLTGLAATLVIAEFDLFWAQGLVLADLSPPLDFQRSLLEIQLVRTPLDGITSLLAVVLFPGLCEELFFRGFVLTSLCAHRGPTAALVGSSLLFSLAHLNPWQLPALLLFGGFLGLLTYWTHSIYPAILTHLTNNLVSLVGVNLRAYLGLELFSPFQHLPWPLVTISLLLLLAGLLLLRRQPTIMPLVNAPPPTFRIPGDLFPHN